MSSIEVATPVIDAHHHLWQYTAEEYSWIDDTMKRLRRDFGVSHLTETLKAAGVDGAIAVQARQTLEETRWLLKLANLEPKMLGVVGWVPLIDQRLEEIMVELAGETKLKGVRHVLQAEPAEYMLTPDFGRGLNLLEHLGLRYDLLLHKGQLPAATELVARHPNLTFVLDHVAKPAIAAGELEPWAQNLRDLARHKNVFCKLSGMVTEATWDTWTPQDLQPYFDVALEAFTPDRLMYGSDWPVCLVASSYSRWINTVHSLIARLSDTERTAIMGGNAIKVYGLHR